ncbi:PREDICTED: uncharacterized protein LOC108757468 [Trachymyrmex cornetzi]|uniref:uncharacterized protein LOC108757468 n=1 Tax=Trachymyrmex cornetzi TaxID=471704 RepID=UPI00084F3D09|nr:PREDICTED: uncharacterized protein LOC108757468 [Trachymyrmex cornetzi]
MHLKIQKTMERKESTLFCDANDFIYDEQGFLIGASKDGSVQFTVNPKNIDISANQLLVNLDNSFEAVIDLRQYKQYFEKLTSTLLSKKREDVTNRKIKNLKKMWEIIAIEMTINGYSVTPRQAENKMKSLNRSYKNMKSHNKKTGRDRADCSYRRELDDILGKKHNIEPLVICGNRIGTKLKEVEKTSNSKASSSRYSAGEDLDIMQEENETITENIEKENSDIVTINARNCTNINSNSTDVNDTSHVQTKKKRPSNVDIIKIPLALF